MGEYSVVKPGNEAIVAVDKFIHVRVKEVLITNFLLKWDILDGCSNYVFVYDPTLTSKARLHAHKYLKYKEITLKVIVLLFSELTSKVT